MKKGFFTFASIAVAALVLGTMASAADSVLLEPTPMSEKTDVTIVKQVAEETTTVEAEAETPELYYYDDGASQFNMGGYVYATWYDGFYPMNGDNSVALNQTVLYMERQLDTYRNGGFDWGYNVTALFGTEHAQCTDDGFDGKWGVSGDGYGMSIYECYASLGWDNMELKVGKFASPLGYESAVGPVRDLNSTSYIHLLEPGTHFGALLTWNISDRFSINGGITKGADTSYDLDDTYGFVFGAKYQLTERLAVSYEGMINRLLDTGDNLTAYMHSIIATWKINCRLTYVFETCYGSMYDNTLGFLAGDGVGIANYFKYQLTDKMEAVVRYEWATDSLLRLIGSDVQELTFGIKYNITENLMIRPEIRYDWVEAGGLKDNGFSGGIGGAFLF